MGGALQSTMENLKMSSIPRSLLLFFLFTLSCSPADSGHRVPLNTIKLPPGFHISLYAAHVPNARSLALSPQGTN